MPLPETWYRRTLADDRIRPALSGPLEVDCVILGGGLAGLTTALTLARAGREVAVLEAEETGFGASGRNGGFVSPGYALAEEKIIAKVGPEVNRALQALAAEGAERVRAEIKALQMPGVDPVEGKLGLLRHEDGGALRRAIEAHPQDGISYVPREELREMLSTPRYFHGRRNARAFHIQPLNYLRGLAAEFERLGGRIFDRSPVVKARLEGAEKRLITPGGEVRARQAVLCSGGYTTPVVPALHRAFQPIWTYVMVSEENPELIGTAIRTREAISDSRKAGDYYRLVDGGRRLLWGGRITTLNDSPEEVVRQLRAEMTTTYPQLTSLKTELAWSGKMSYARHQMPQIGRLCENVWHATAFGGHGLNTTATGGQVVAEDILGISDRINLFKDFRLSWAGGPVGLAVAQMTYWWLQAQDRRAEAKADRLAGAVS